MRAYHGKRTLPKTHVARMRIAMPATTDYWINDATGEPLFVVTTEANAGLVKMLPDLCKEIRGLVGERRVTIVFDRGGWSPTLFGQLIADGFDILTYRKGRSRRRLRWEFCEHRAMLDGREVVYQLADHSIRLLGGKLELRQVVRLADDGKHQTQVVTSRRDLPAIEVAYRMFERWRQENFFKYLRDEYALDALVDYQLEPADPQRDVPNPARTKLDAKLRQARNEVIKLSARYGIEALVNREAKRRTMRGFKIATAKLATPVKDALRRYARLEAQRARVPRRIPVGEVVAGDVVQLATERKHLTDVIKMVAYQAETDLVRRITPHYHRADDEARTLVQSALANAGDIAVTATELRVTFAALSSPHRRPRRAVRRPRRSRPTVPRHPAARPLRRRRLRSGQFSRRVCQEVWNRVPEAGQLVLFKPRGGKRRGAGRPSKGKRAGSPHKPRPFLHARYPVHVVLRAVAAVSNLRRRCVYQAIREATITTARRDDFRIVQLSLQRTHVHLLVEADDAKALARGMQGFQISAAKHLNAAISQGKPGPRRRGPVFPDRYHAEIITSPRQARHALSYVVNNWRKHQEDRKAPMSGWTIDWFSSAVTFPGWSEYGDEPLLWRGPPTYDPLVVYQPKTWLLREGWRKAGAISCREIPSAAR